MSYSYQQTLSNIFSFCLLIRIRSCHHPLSLSLFILSYRYLVFVVVLSCLILSLSLVATTKVIPPVPVNVETFGEVRVFVYVCVFVASCCVFVASHPPPP
jgi:hypothetical protein